MTPIAIVRVVTYCSRRAWLVIAAFALLAVASGYYVVRNFQITTDSSKLLSASLPWRQQEIALNKAFPQRTDQIIAVVDGSTPERATSAATDLADNLAQRKDLFISVRLIASDPFYARNGILFQPLQDVRRETADLVRAQPFLGTLAADPSMRGIMTTFSQALKGIRLKKTTLEDLARPLALISDALELIAAGHDPAFSWRALISSQPLERGEMRRFVELRPKLDFDALQPGGAATDAIRAVVAKLDLTLGHGTRVRLTGPIALADEEFGTVAEGAEVNGIVTVLIVTLLLWLALKRPRIILAVLVNLFVGLAVTAAVGLAMVGTLNLISVAFAVLFVGLGVDFGIQFSVRYRAERHALPDLQGALRATAVQIGAPLLLAATATAAGFLSFLPTAYRGLSELGLIAGVGMLIAFATTISLLPALLAALNPKGESAEIGFKALAPVDHFLEEKRFWIVGITLGAAVAALPLLMFLKFDFNPLDLRSRTSESVSTLLDMMQDPNTSPDTIDALEPNLKQAEEVAKKIAALPEVARSTTLASFVPIEQDQKLAAIEDANFFLQDTVNPVSIKPYPTDAESVAAMRTTALDLLSTVGQEESKTAGDARQMARLLTSLADAPPAARAAVDVELVGPLKATLDQVRSLLKAEKVTLETLPKSIVDDWITADGRARIEVAPKGNSNDNSNLQRFASAVRSVAPDAAGAPVFVQEAAKTVVTAFLQAGALSVLTITILLFVVLRRALDVALTLVPLMVAIVVTLEICVVIDLQLNFANIIALPLLLGVGVAFKIYYVMAWRAGATHFLQLSLTRAVLFSALATATAFGSLWLSHHPGTSSMGKLMALALVTTLSAAVLFQPALLATRKHHAEEKPAEDKVAGKGAVDEAPPHIII